MERVQRMLINITFNFVLESGTGTEGRQECHEFLEVQAIQHSQQALSDRLTPQIESFQL